MLTILQGDELTIPITITNNGTTVNIKNIEVLRVTIGGSISKEYPNGDIYFDGNAFQVPITQSETFSLSAGRNSIIIRPKFNGGGIRGTVKKGEIYVQSSDDTKEI
jgi:hypothetical protein